MKVVFIDRVHKILWQRLHDNGCTCIDATLESEQDCLSIINDADGIVIRSRFSMDSNFLIHAKRLKFIARSGAGMENIDASYCKEHNIVLFNAPEGNRNAVGEHALGMLLCLLNKLHIADNEIRRGEWKRESNRGVELDGKTIGIIGYGNNGSAFAKKLKGFDVEILAYDKYRSGFATSHCEEVELQTIFQRADIVSFHIPETEETISFADDEFFDSFKQPIYVLNLARGKIVNTSALVRALKSQKVLGACLDVLEYEKASFESLFEQGINDDFKFLLSSEQVILSPHVGGWTQESYFKLSDVLADKILQHFN